MDELHHTLAGTIDTLNRELRRVQEDHAQLRRDYDTLATRSVHLAQTAMHAVRATGPDRQDAIMGIATNVLLLLCLGRLGGRIEITQEQFMNAMDDLRDAKIVESPGANEVDLVFEIVRP